jgi:pyridoxal phosphate enzyme (YggS family)
MATEANPVERGLAAVHEAIGEACRRVGRDPGGVLLVAVSKEQPDGLVRAAYRAGVRDFGENYAQGLRDRAARLVDLNDVRWHLIGPLQTNKARYTARLASAFNALDRLEVAEALSRRRQGPALPCYVELNLSGEPRKAGVPEGEAAGLVEAVREVPGLHLVGLMTMPPFSPDPESSRPYFRRLRELATDLDLVGLSMGMSGDFEVAVEEGATVVRVGEAIFGDRPGG